MSLALYLSRVRSSDLLDDELCELREEQTTLLSAAILRNGPRPTVTAEVKAYRPIERYRLAVTNVASPVYACSHIITVK
jgi:hypothetical protein